MPKSFPIAERMAKLDASGIRKVFDLAAAMKDPINLSIGQPDFDVPEPVRREAAEAIARGFNKYTQTQGTAELRAAVGKGLAEEFGWTDERPVLITSGVSGALLLAFLSVINPGDEVIILEPYFVMYSHLVNLCGGVPVCISTYPSFRPDADRMAEAITPRTKMLVVNSPCNPTGAVYTQAELLLMRGFSKTYAMTGWRLGWCTGPKNVLEKMTMLQQYSFVCAPSMAQAAGIVALGVDVSQHQDQYRRKRDMVFAALARPLGLAKPGGAFYAFVPAPKGQTATQFVTRAIQNNVLIIPGNVFSTQDTHFRLSYATSDEKLAQGLGILVKLA
jgi:aspartate aminotransferase/aminotransferase